MLKLLREGFHRAKRANSMKPWHAVLITVVSSAVAFAVFAYLKFWRKSPDVHAVGWPLLIAYFVPAFAWAFLDPAVERVVFRADFVFGVLTIIVLILVTITGEPFSEFPQWGVIALIASGVIAYLPTARLGIRNYLRWRNGEFDEHC